MGEDLIHRVNKLRMVKKCLPVVGGRHRHRTVSLDAADDLGKFGRGVFMPEDCFIAHDQPGDVGVVPREVERGLDLALVSGFVLIDPDAQRDRQPEFSRDLWNAFQTLRRGVGAYRLCLFGNRGEIGADPRFGHCQIPGRSFGKSVVRDARQLRFNRCRNRARLCQTPDRQMQTRDRAKN